MESVDWRTTELSPNARQKIVNKIIDGLKKYNSVLGPEKLQQLKNMAIMFEEKIYTRAESKLDYMHNISIKLVEISKVTGNPVNPSDPANFSKLACPSQDTEKRVPRAMKIIPSPETRFSSIMAAKRLTLSDVEQEIARKEKSSPDSGKKRKNPEPINVDDSPQCLNFEEASKHLTLAVEQLIGSHKKALGESLKENTIKLQKDHVADMNKLKEKHASELEELKKEHSQAMKEFRMTLLKDAVMLVIEAKIKMAKEATTKDFDASSWDVSAWEKRLAELGGVARGGSVLHSIINRRRLTRQ